MFLLFKRRKCFQSIVHHFRRVLPAFHRGSAPDATDQREEGYVQAAMDGLESVGTLAHRCHGLQVHVGALDGVYLGFERHPCTCNTVELIFVRLLLPQSRLCHCCRKKKSVAAIGRSRRRQGQYMGAVETVDEHGPAIFKER